MPEYLSLTWKVFMGFITFGFKSLRNLYKIQLSSLNGVKPKKYVHRFPAAFDDGFFLVVNNGRFSPLLSCTWKVFMGFVTFGFKSPRNLYKIQLSSLNGVKPKKYVHRFPAAFDDGFFVVVNNGRFSPLLSCTVC